MGRPKDTRTWAVVMANGKAIAKKTSHRGLAQIIKTGANEASVQFINPNDSSDFTWYKYTGDPRGGHVNRKLNKMLEAESIGSEFAKTFRNNKTIKTKKVTDKREIADLQARYGHKI